MTSGKSLILGFPVGKMRVIFLVYLDHKFFRAGSVPLYIHIWPSITVL